MTFQEQILSTFIGTLFGFIFAIILFIITTVIVKWRTNTNLKRHLKREFEYDISLLKGWISEIDKVLRKVTLNDFSVYSYLNYSYFQRTFIQKAFDSGIMYNKLDNEDISQLNTILTHCNINLEDYINSFIKKWKGNLLEQKEMSDQFEYEKDLLDKYIKYLGKILKKLNN